MNIECRCPKHPAWVVWTAQGPRAATADELLVELERRERLRAECEAEIREVQGWRLARHEARPLWAKLFDWLFASG